MAGLRARHWGRVLSALGLVLWAGFLWNFVRELGELDVVWPPFLAVLLGTGLSLALVYAGYRIGHEERLDAAATRRIAGWCIGGLVLLTAVSGLTIAIRYAEGRRVGEPLLDVLVSANAGALAGVLVGHSYTRARRDAERTRRARRALAFLNSTLRHELLNGLNIVQGKAARLSEEIDDDDHQARLDTIRSRGDDMADLIRNARAFARTFTTGRDLEPVDLSAVLAERIALTRESFPDATVTADIPSGVHVHANEAIGHVFENLLQNAVEHNDTDAPEVHVGVDVSSDTAAVRIADNGPGIPDDRKEAVFEPETERDHGFGLYLVRTLVTHYGGEIRVADNDPEGSVFTVELRRARPDGSTVGRME